MNSARFLTLGRSWSATCRHWILAASASSWAKAVPMKAETTRALLAGMGQHIAHEVHPAALPGGVQDLGDGSLQALMGIRDNQLDATQTAPGELAQKVGP